MFTKRNLLLAPAACAILVGFIPSGCNKDDPKNAGVTNAAFGPESSPIEPVLDQGWCAGHGVPESVCTRCNSSLTPAFKQAGDWCDEHGLPESQCFTCHPEIQAEWARLNPATRTEARPTDVRPAIGDNQSSDEAPITIKRIDSSLRVENNPDCDVENSLIRFLNPAIARDAGIHTGRAAPRRISASVTCPAEIRYDPTRLAHLTPRAPGVVLEVRVNTGDEVNRDDVLAVVDSPYLGRAKSDYIAAREAFLIAQADLNRHNTIHEAIIDMLAACSEEASSEKLRERFADKRVGSVKSRLLNAHAQLDYARQRYQREKDLHEKGITSEEAFQEARNALDRAEADFVATHEDVDIELEKEHLELERALRVARVAMDAARRELQIAGLSETQIDVLDGGHDEGLGRYEVRSPIAGTIVQRHAVPGESVRTETTLFTVADLSTLWLMLNLEERDLAVVRPGQHVQFHMDGLPGHAFTGRIQWLSSEVDPRTRTVLARVPLDNDSDLLRANMFGQARVIVRHDDHVLAVPQDALQSDGCCNLVFVRESDTVYHPRKVQPGVSSNGFVEITKGLADGETVVTTGSFLLKTEIMKSSIGAGCCEVDPGR